MLFSYIVRHVPVNIRKKLLKMRKLLRNTKPKVFFIYPLYLKRPLWYNNLHNESRLLVQTECFISLPSLLAIRILREVNKITNIYCLYKKSWPILWVSYYIRFHDNILSGNTKSLLLTKFVFYSNVSLITTKANLDTNSYWLILQPPPPHGTYLYLMVAQK